MSTHMQAEADLIHSLPTLENLGHLLSKTIKLNENGSYYIELEYATDSLKKPVADPMFVGGTLVVIKFTKVDKAIEEVLGYDNEVEKTDE